MERHTGSWAGSTLNQKIGLVFGLVYVAVGFAGFLVTSGVGFAATQGKDLILFELNPLHNLVHVAVGAVLAGSAYGHAKLSREVNVAVGAVYLLVGILGLFIVGTDLNLLALNQPDNALHFASAAVLAAVGLRDVGRREAEEVFATHA